MCSIISDLANSDNISLLDNLAKGTRRFQGRESPATGSVARLATNPYRPRFVRKGGICPLEDSEGQIAKLRIEARLGAASDSLGNIM